MWPLLICSIIGASILMERSFFFSRLKFDYERFKDELLQQLRSKKIKAARDVCKKSSNPISRIAQVYLENFRNDELRDDILKREGSHVLEKLESWLRTLASITHIAPLLGLLGTVTGLVTAFHEIELLGGQVQPADLAGGIWQALITTVFGLVIAIPCMAGYHGFESKADKISRQMQFVVSELDEFFQKHSKSSFQAENPENKEDDLRTIS